MASLTEHVMINKLGDDLDSAITFVGGDTAGVDNIMQYPTIIREQLSASGITFNKSIILEGDSAVIIADSEGRDSYNTEYAVGEKTGLNPGAYYIRICTAVKDIEPVYIDLTPVIDLVSNGESVDIDTIVDRVIKSPEIVKVIQDEINKQIYDLEKRVSILEKRPEGVTEGEVLVLIENSLKSYASKEELTLVIERVEGLEQAADRDLDYIVQQIIESDTINNTFVSDVELENMMFSEEELENILTI